MARYCLCVRSSTLGSLNVNMAKYSIELLEGTLWECECAIFWKKNFPEIPVHPIGFFYAYLSKCMGEKNFFKLRGQTIFVHQNCATHNTTHKPFSACIHCAIPKTIMQKCKSLSLVLFCIRNCICIIFCLQKSEFPFFHQPNLFYTFSSARTYMYVYVRKNAYTVNMYMGVRGHV